MPEQPTGALRPRRYSQAFREPVLTASGSPRFNGGQPTPEAFYFEKQMQQHTQLVIVLEDGERVEGVLEWYDASSLKLRRENGGRVMVYKHAIKYLHKQNGLNDTLS